MYNGRFSLYVENRFVTKFSVHLYFSPSVYGFCSHCVCFAQMQNTFFSYSNETAQHCLLKQSQQFNKTLKWTTYRHPGSEISPSKFCTVSYGLYESFIYFTSSHNFNCPLNFMKIKYFLDQYHVKVSIFTLKLES